jgi:uncharacterized protein YecA (UPF0149 family)
LTAGLGETSDEIELVRMSDADYRLAMRHLGPSDLEPLRVRQYLRRRRAVARAAAGRNDPCPCGSGRKYKKCCLR